MCTYYYRTEKHNVEEDIRSLCQAADERLLAFANTLNLECLDMFKENNNDQNDGNENNYIAELPQVCYYFLNIIYTI